MEITSLVPSVLKEYDEIKMSDWQKKYWRLSSEENKIKELLSNIQSDFMLVAYRLLDIRDSGLYMADYTNGSDIYRYATVTFGFSKTFVHNLIAIAEKFSNKRVGLKDEYKGYGISQLVELSTLPESLHKYFDPKMTIKQMREVKKGCMVGMYADSGSGRVWHTFKIPASELTQISSDVTKPEQGKIAALVQIPTSEFSRADQKSNIETESFEPSTEAKTFANKSFKNDKERDAFMADYENWALWLDIPALKLKVHRVELSDDSIILAYAYTSNGWKGEDCKEVKYRRWKKAEDVCFSGYFEFSGQIVDVIRRDKLMVK
jgi:hypothetical protein